MKRFTIVFSLLLVFGFVATLLYVAALPEFVPPAQFTMGADEDPDAPIWDMTLEEVLAALEAEGYIDASDPVELAASGLCTRAVSVNGAEFYWWDLDNLQEGSQEYIAYQSLKKDGIINIYGSGNIFSYTHIGPFALWVDLYEGDPGPLKEAFKALGQEDPST